MNGLFKYVICMGNCITYGIFTSNVLSECDGSKQLDNAHLVDSDGGVISLVEQNSGVDLSSLLVSPDSPLPTPIHLDLDPHGLNVVVRNDIILGTWC